MGLGFLKKGMTLGFLKMGLETELIFGFFDGIKIERRSGVLWRVT